MPSPRSATARPRVEAADRADWLSLRDAAQVMGVHPATLRTWADRGRIASQRTAGGHRRFSRADLHAWLEARRSSESGAQVLAQNALGRLRLEMDGVDAPWLARFDESTRRAHRELGRRLMQAATQAASAGEMTGAVRAAAEGIGREYAALSRRGSLTLVEAVQAFLFFRDTIIGSLVQLAGALEPVAATSWLSVHHRLSAFLNEVLLALVRSYEESRRG